MYIFQKIVTAVMLIAVASSLNPFPELSDTKPKSCPPGQSVRSGGFGVCSCTLFNSTNNDIAVTTTVCNEYIQKYGGDKAVVLTTPYAGHEGDLACITNPHYVPHKFSQDFINDCQKTSPSGSGEGGSCATGGKVYWCE